MPGATLKILHGPDRGRVFCDLIPPFTVGRDEVNDIQLNDERVSRCHFKIQRDNDRLVLTDLDSTNGTKVNGVDCPLKILRSGDLISVGGSLMLVGSEEEIAARLAALGSENPTMSLQMASSDDPVELELSQEKSPFQMDIASVREIPQVPENLSPGQKTQLCEILDFLQHRLCKLVESAKIDESSHMVTLKLSSWQRLLGVQARLGEMHRKIADPDWNGEHDSAGTALIDECDDADQDKKIEHAFAKLCIWFSKGKSVCCRDKGKELIQNALLEGNSVAFQTLRTRFSKIVVIRGDEAVDTDGVFCINRFQDHVVNEVANSFDYPNEDRHPGEVRQYLVGIDRDTLFCFTDVACLERLAFRALRGMGFFDFGHYVLYVGHNPYLDSRTMQYDDL